MNLPKLSFLIAGWWGVLSLTPMFFAFDIVGRKNPPPITHPEFYFGFLCVAYAWQVGFFVISANPPKYRAMMVPAMIEKFGYALTCGVLFLTHRASASTALFGSSDLLFGGAFLASWWSLRRADAADTTQ